jgi:hypothetical protein
MTLVARVEREPFVKTAIEATSLPLILDEVESMLLDVAEGNWHLSDGEGGVLRTFEAVATTAIEDGKPCIVNGKVADVLLGNDLARPIDFVDAVPLTVECWRWVQKNPDTCTQDFDGICRCLFS